MTSLMSQPEKSIKGELCTWVPMEESNCGCPDCVAILCKFCSHVHLHSDRCGEHIYPLSSRVSGEGVCNCIANVDDR